MKALLGSRVGAALTSALIVSLWTGQAAAAAEPETVSWNPDWPRFRASQAPNWSGATKRKRAGSVARLHRWGPVSQLLAGLTLAGCAAHGPASAPRAGAAALTLASFNLYFPAARDPETVEAVAATAADVIFLQEVSPGWEAVLRQRYAEEYPHMLFAARGGASGLGVLSRVALEDAGFMPAVIKHPAWLVRVRWPAFDLYVLNVHLRASRRPGQNWLSGVLSIGEDHETEMRAFFQMCRVEPTVVVGDFNEGAGGPAVRWLVQSGFSDVLEHHSPGGATWRAAGGLLSTTFDHILFRGCLEALDARVVHSGNSDHWPLVVRFETVPAAACR